MNPAGPSNDSPRALVATSTPPPPQQMVETWSLREAEAKLTTALTAAYRPNLPIYSVRGAEVLGWYFFADVEVMRMHPDVSLPLSYFMGPMAYAEWDIEASSPAVAIYAAKQLQWFWQNAQPDLYERGCEYGWSAGEFVTTERDGLLVYDKFTTFSPRDCCPLVYPDGPHRGKPIGVRLTNTMGGSADMWAFRDNVPNKAFWYCHRPMGGQRWGESQIRRAWRFWRRLAGVDGMEEIEDLACHRFGTGIVKVLHPNEVITAEQAGMPSYQQNGMVHTRDIARLMSQQLKAGAGVTLSSEAWPTATGNQGQKKWDVVVESFNTNIEQLGNHDDRLARKCSKAIGVPPELFEAAQTGSGYSGRAIPLQGFLVGQQHHLQRWTVAAKVQAIEPMCKWNFGPKAWVRITPKPLTESVRKSSWESPGPSDPGSMVPQPPQSNGVDLPPGGGDDGGQPSQMMATRMPARILSPTNATDLDVDQLLAIRKDLLAIRNGMAGTHLTHALAVRHAKKGGQFVQGDLFAGGEFLPLDASDIGEADAAGTQKKSVNNPSDPLASVSTNHYTGNGSPESGHAGRTGESRSNGMTDTTPVAAHDPRAAFEAAIKAAPHDDAPRLVYADWLDENGDPDAAKAMRTPPKVAGGRMAKMLNPKELGFYRKGRGAVKVGEVVERKDGRYVVTKVTSSYVSDDDIEDQDAWHSYPDGPGYYTSYSAVAVRDTEAEKIADAVAAQKADSAEKEKSAKEAAASQKFASAWDAVKDHRETYRWPASVPQPKWEEAANDIKQGPAASYGTSHDVGTLPDGRKVGRRTSTSYDDHRVSYYLPQDLHDEITIHRAMELGRDHAENTRLAGSDDYYRKEGEDFLAAYDRMPPEKQAKVTRDLASAAKVHTAPAEQQWDEAKRHYRETGHPIEPDGARSAVSHAERSANAELDRLDPAVRRQIKDVPEFAHQYEAAVYGDDMAGWQSWVREAAGPGQAKVDADRAKVDADRATKTHEWQQWYEDSRPALAEQLGQVVPAELVPAALDYVRSEIDSVGHDLRDEFREPKAWAENLRTILGSYDDGDIDADDNPELHAHAVALRAKREEEAAEKKRRAKKAKADNPDHEVTGNSYPHRERIKSLGGRWDAKNRRWIIPASAAGRLPRGLSSSPL